MTTPTTQRELDGVELPEGYTEAFINNLAATPGVLERLEQSKRALGFSSQPEVAE